MKKPIRKLVVRGETLRTLRALDNRDLVLAVGGRETGDVCTSHVAVVTPIGGG